LKQKSVGGVSHSQGRCCFRAIKYRPCGRGEVELNGERLHQIDGSQMVRRGQRGR